MAFKHRSLFTGGSYGALVSSLTPTVGTGLVYQGGDDHRTSGPSGVPFPNEAYVGGDSGTMRCADDPGAADYVVRGVIVHRGTSTTPVWRIFGRRTDNGNAYYIEATLGSIVLKVVSTAEGVETLGSIARTLADDTPEALDLVMVGSIISVWRNAAPVITATDSTHATKGAAGEYTALFTSSDSNGYDRGPHWQEFSVNDTIPTTAALVVTTQPSNTASGYVMSPAPVVRMTTDGSTTDTGFTGNITVAIVGPGGVLLGTTTVAASAGVATFNALRPCIAGTYQLRFSASGVPDLDSANFTVTSGSGATISGGDMPDVEIRRNEGTANLRRIPLLIEDDAGAAWAGSVTGVKARLSQNFGSETDSPADIVRVAGKLHYVECAQAYTDIAEGGKITARVPAASGRREALAIGKIIPADTYAAAVNETSLTNKIVRAVNGADGYIVEKDPLNNQITLTIPGVGTITIPARFLDSSKPVDALGTT